MIAFVRCLLVCVLSTYISAHAIDKMTFGSYTGVMTNELLGKDQLVRLELIPLREPSGSISLQGILSIQFGGFDSGEYVSYHYHEIAFNFLSGALTFSQSDQEVYVTSGVIKNDTFTGDLYSSTGKVGSLALSTKNSVFPKNGLVEPVNGEYKGFCGKTPSSLQLFTYRSTDDNSRLGNAFGAYEVKGQIGKYDPNLCLDKKETYCTHSKIKSASYDYFTGGLVLNGFPFSYQCTVSGGKIDCGDCQFKRSSDEMRKPQLLNNSITHDPFANIGFKPETEVEKNNIKGKYIGYLFHDKLKKYQNVQIDFSSFQRPTSAGSTLIVSAVAQLHFGKSSSEVISYKFNPIEFPNPTQKPQFILARTEEDVDAVLRVTDIGGGIVKGTWYSVLYGRVGSFLAAKGGLGDVDEKDLIPSVSSVYEESGKNGERDFIMDIVVSKGRAPLGSDNPFYPLNLKGWLWRKKGSVKKEDILEGSYDFYTGRIALLYGDDRIVSGELNSDQQPKFRRLGGKFGTLMQSYQLVPYRQKQRRETKP